MYVSSDRTGKQLESYKKKNWMTVPFDNVDERDNIKRHFRTCAKVEMDSLGMTSRKHEIPTIIVIDSKTEQVLSYHGVKDVKHAVEHGGEEANSATAAAESLVDSWIELKRLSTSLQDKYVE